MTIVSPVLFFIALQGAPTRVALQPATATVPVGSTVRLQAAVFDDAGNRLTGVAIRWVSTDEEIVTIDNFGVVTGVRPGTAQVAAFVPGAPAFATITVPQVPASEIELGLPVTDLPTGTSAPLSVEISTRFGDGLPPTAARFASSSPSVARVDPTGRVFALGAGVTTITATSGDASARISITVRDVDAARGDAKPRFFLTPDAPTTRTGDVVRFQTILQTGDRSERLMYPAWSVDGAGAQIEADGADGVFVAENPGLYRVTALIGDGYHETTVIDVVQRNTPARLTKVGRGATPTHHAGDTWAFEGVDGRDYAYLGTFMHDWMKVFDVTDPANPALTDSLQLDARRINDVKIHPNNRIGIVTREGASNRRNGMVILDLSRPAHPTVLSEYTETVTGGVHNVWITGSDLVYAVHNGTSEMHIIDISDPARPREVGRWGLDKRSKSLHDVIVQDGYAFLSYWNDGVIILDVGASTHGGTPTAPAFLSQYKYPIGNTHVAWRAGRYLFLGDEIFPPNWNADAPIEARGYIHVVDVSDIDHLQEVARYEVPEAGAHNVWVDGDRLYVGYYQGGLRVVDIAGELRGDLYRQGRELAVIKTTDANTTVPNWPMTWGAQIFKGNIITSDLNSGLWILKLTEEVVVP